MVWRAVERREMLRVFEMGIASQRVEPYILGRMTPKGLYRERNGWGAQHSARVKYDEHQELDVPEDRYRERGYQPPFDELPWKDEIANDN